MVQTDTTNPINYTTPTQYPSPYTGPTDPNAWWQGGGLPSAPTSGGTMGQYQSPTPFTEGASDTPRNTPPGTTPDPGLTQEQSSAKALITGSLATYGLGSLADWAWKKWQNGESIDQIFLELRDTPEYKTRFPAMAELSKSGHAISEAQYIDLETTYTQIGRQYGLPSGFYDQPSDFTALIAGQVSPTEFQQRVQDYSTLAYEVDPTVRAQLRDLYGVDEGHIAAWAIDPNKALPVLQRQFGAVQAAAAAARSGYGQLGVQDAELISGIAPEALQKGFGTLYTNRELFSTLPGEAGAGIDRATQLGAAFLGDAAAQQAIEKEAKKRVATFAAGGTVQQSQKGYAGAG